jgi:hypothetical protein
MTKQGSPTGSPQQLTLDLDANKRDSRDQLGEVSCVRNFIDSGTLAIRRQAIERVKSAKIFALPATRSN